MTKEQAMTKIKSYKGIVVANEIIQVAINAQNPLSQISVLKLLYFANAAYLVLYNKRLIEEDFYAWEFGPVIPQVYGITKQYGSSLITQTINGVDRIDANDENALEVVKVVYDNLKNFKPFGLVDITHRKGGAWHKAHSIGRYTIIKDNDIIEEYKDIITK